jgi:hypothetical protein
MRYARTSLFSDESGLLTQEWIFLLVICVIGIITGIGVMRDAVSVSFLTGSEAIGVADPGYNIPDYQGKGYTAKGSSYTGGTVSAQGEIYPQ